jgi:hypothetical protein
MTLGGVTATVPWTDVEPSRSNPDVEPCKLCGKARHSYHKGSLCYQCEDKQVDKQTTRRLRDWTNEQVVDLLRANQPATSNRIADLAGVEVKSMRSRLRYMEAIGLIGSVMEFRRSRNVQVWSVSDERGDDVRLGQKN